MDTETSPKSSLRDILYVIFKRKITILLFLAVAVCTGAIRYSMAVPIYEAKAQLLVKIGREDVYMPTLPGGGPTKPIISTNRTEQVNSEMEILRSRFLAEKVIQFLGPTVIYKDLDGTGQGLLAKAIKRFQKAFTIEGIRESSIINIRFRHTSPRVAATVVNTLVDFFLERHLEVHKRHDPQVFFRQQYLILKEKTKLAEENLQAFRNRHNLSLIDQEQSFLLSQEASLRSALNQTLNEKAETENRIRQLRHQLATTPDAITVDDNNRIDEVQVKLVERLVELELQEHQLLTKYNDQNRFIQRIRYEIKMVRRMLAKHRSNITLRYEAELQALKAKEESQGAQLAAIQKKHEKINRLALEFDRLQQTIEVLRENYRLYLAKFEEARISDAMDKEKIANIKVIETARPPFESSSSGLFRTMAFAIFLGGAGGFGLAFFSEYLDDSLEKNEDVENHLRLPVLASIPQLER